MILLQSIVLSDVSDKPIAYRFKDARSKAVEWPGIVRNSLSVITKELRSGDLEGRTFRLIYSRSRVTALF